MNNKEEKTIRYEYRRGEESIFPTHQFVNNWKFDAKCKEEAELANALAFVAEKNGMTTNDLSHLFPAILRMLKSDTAWSK